MARPAAKGRISARSETTSQISFRNMPSFEAWPCSRASMPSMAFSAMRTNNTIGSSQNSQRVSGIQAIAAPAAIDSTAAAIVT